MFPLLSAAKITEPLFRKFAFLLQFCYNLAIRILKGAFWMGGNYSKSIYNQLMDVMERIAYCFWESETYSKRIKCMR